MFDNLIQYLKDGETMSVRAKMVKNLVQKIFYSWRLKLGKQFYALFIENIVQFDPKTYNLGKEAFAVKLSFHFYLQKDKLYS